MTREEAIKVLTNLQNGHGVSYSEDYGLCFGHKWMQAYEMAIAALRYDGPKYVLLSTPPADAQTIDTGVPFTNAQHIRSMTDEELAEYLWVETDKTFNYCDVCKHYRLTAPHCAVRSQGSECIKARVDWLKQPYKEDA